MSKLSDLIFGNNCKPSFLHWSMGGKVEASPAQARSVDFRLWSDPAIERRDFSFRQEVFEACKLLDKRRGKMPIALCYSGGTDSDLIANALSALGIPFELYFLDIWSLNRAPFDIYSERLPKKIGKKVNVVSLDRAFFYEEHSLKLFREFGVELPTYLALSYLFTQIPKSEFIVVGDGDLNRTGKLFESIGKRHPPPAGDPGLYLPFSTSSVFYYSWAQKYRRAGEFYFFSSTPGLIASVISNPLFKCDFPTSDTREIIYDAFPELDRREKTTNWDGPAYRENVWIRSWLENKAEDSKDFGYWRMGAGTVARVDQIFHS